MLWYRRTWFRRLRHASTPGGGRSARWRRPCAGWAALAVVLGCRAAVAGPPPPADEPVVVSHEVGRPLIQNYTRRDVGGGVQQWDVVQDARGIVYFANNAGVLEFDGRRWRLIELPSRFDVRALASDAAGSGRIYVGTGGDFGYLRPDESGQLQFTSLLPPEARLDRSFDQAFRPVSTPDGQVYFQSPTRLCRWSGERVVCRETPPTLSRIFFVNRRLYVQQQGAGLMEMTPDGARRPVPGGARFADGEIRVLLPYTEGGEPGLLVGLRTSELFVSRGGTFEPFAPALYDPQADEKLDGGAVLPDGSFALGSRLRGLLIVDRAGRLLRQIDRAAGLQDNYVHAVLPDQQGGLWLALQTGASRVEIASRYSVFDEASGLEQEWRAIVRHEGRLYVRGYTGLFAAAPPAPSAAPARPGRLRFTRVAGVEAPVPSMLRVNDRLLLASLNAVDEIRAQRLRSVVRYRAMPGTLYRSRADPRRVYVGLADGLASLLLDAGVWRDEGRVPGIGDSITSMAEAADGSLWLVSQRQRVLRVEFAGGAATTRPADRSPRVSLYQGGELFAGRIAVQELAGRPIFLSERAIAEFDEPARRFVPAAGFAALDGLRRRSFSQVTEDRHGNLWVASRKPGAVDFLRKQPDGSYRVENAGVRQALVWSIYAEDASDVVWLCTPEYLLRYDPSLHIQPRSFATLVRRVTADERRLVYGGAPLPIAAAAAGAADRPALAPSTRSLQFEFAATAFDSPEHNEFQSQLEAFDKEWSSWTTSPSRVYTNLPPGEYRFHVRARDIHGQMSDSSVYRFAVLPAWYQTRWAYLLYAGLAAVGLVLIRRFERRQSEARLRRERAYMELEKLRELDGLKSRFFADISHELRTPLTLILAPIEQLLNEPGQPRVAQKLQLVRSNIEYLLRLIGQILDLSKLEARRTRLRVAPGDLVDCLERGVAVFAPAAEARGITLRFESRSAPAAGDAPDAFFDRDVVEKILNNVVGNAVKFTPSGGAVSVSLETRPEEAGPWAEIRVADTGVGIPAAHLSRIFDRFYQVDGVRSREGIGIGLALVKELVELHHGRITIESIDGEGTTAVMRMPIGRARFTPDELAPIPAAPAEPAVPCVSGKAAAAPAIVVASREADAAAVDAEPPADPEDDTAVLVVEDNVRVRVFVREQLQPYYRVLEAGNGAEGFDMAVSSLPDLVLSDVLMPGMDGYELCRALKDDKRTCHIPVMLLTARAGRDDRLQGFDTGADSYLVKPFDSSEMLVQVRNLIEQRRRLRERFSAPIVLKPSELRVAPMDEAFLEKVLSAVQANLADPDFDIVQLGREVGLSRSQLHRKLRALTNQSPTLLVRSIRLRRAAELLRQRAGSVAEIAYGVGFGSQAYFAKCFREELGCSPKEYARGVDGGPPPPQPGSDGRPGAPG